MMLSRKDAMLQGTACSSLWLRENILVLDLENSINIMDMEFSVSLNYMCLAMLVLSPVKRFIQCL